MKIYRSKIIKQHKENKNSIRKIKILKDLKIQILKIRNQEFNWNRKDPMKDY